EAVRDAALEIVGLAGPEHAHLAADGNLNLAGDDDAALLALVDDHGLAGIAARRHHLAQDAHLPLRAMLADQIVVDAVGTHVRQFVGRVERLLGFARVQVLGDEGGQRDRDAIQHLLQRADGGADLVLLDQRDRAVGDAHATGQLALAEATGRAYPLQACADVHPRRSAPLPGAPACCRILYMAPRDGQFFGIDSGPALNLSN